MCGKRPTLFPKTKVSDRTHELSTIVVLNTVPPLSPASSLLIWALVSVRLVTKLDIN